MAINLIKSHVVGKACYEYNLTDYNEMINNPQLQQWFNTDATLIFQFDEFSENEVLIKKGSSDITTPNLSQFFIVNNAGFLEIYLAELDGLHWLCYRSTNQILRTKRRKLIALKYTKVTNLVELLVDSLPEPIAIKTGGNLRTLASDFTGINTSNTNNVVYARGDATGFPDSFSTIYHDSYDAKLLTQTEINTIYQTWRDTRVLPSIGKVIFSSDRLGNGYDLWEMNADGTDPVVLQTGLGDFQDPRYNKTPATDGDYTWVNGTSIFTIFDSPNNAIITPSNIQVAWYGGSKNANGSKFFVNTFNLSAPFIVVDANTLTLNYPTLDLYSNTFSNNGWRSFWDLDAHPTDPLKVAIVAYDNGLVSPKIVIVTLNPTYTTSGANSIVVHSSSWNVSAYNARPNIEKLKFSHDGTKIGFNEYLGAGYTNLQGRIINADGSGSPLDLGLNTEFVAFSPDGVSVLLKKTVGGKSQLFTRNLTTNKEVNISNNAWNDNYGDWKA